MAQVLFVYSTIDGHTRDICEKLGQVVGNGGMNSSLFELTPENDIDPARADVIVLGASIRYGKHRPEVTRFIERHLESLKNRPAAFFSVNAVARKVDKRDPQTNPYVRKYLQSISWRPPLIGIFGGQIDYPRYGFFDKTMIRLIMWITKGPTDPDGTFDFTDWDEVDEFGAALCRMANGEAPKSQDPR